jgi:hypothetical protein
MPNQQFLTPSEEYKVSKRLRISLDQFTNSTQYSLFALQLAKVFMANVADYLSPTQEHNASDGCIALF